MSSLYYTMVCCHYTVSTLCLVLLRTVIRYIRSHCLNVICYSLVYLTFIIIYLCFRKPQRHSLRVKSRERRSTAIMTAAENVCYTLINVTNDSEPPSEVSLKADLGNPTCRNLLVRRLPKIESICVAVRCT